MSTKNTPAAKAKADIDLENELWNAANELRGAVAENQYKDSCFHICLKSTFKTFLL